MRRVLRHRGPTIAKQRGVPAEMLSNEWVRAKTAVLDVSDTLKQNASHSPEDSPNMDFNTFDNDADESDENYFAYIDWLSELTANDLRHVKDNPEQQKQALCRC
jgi:hypothetical protein